MAIIYFTGNEHTIFQTLLIIKISLICQNLLELQHIDMREVFMCGGRWLPYRSHVTPNINSF